MSDCPNDHGGDGIIPCWSPGGPCPDGRRVCESCGPCAVCRPAEHPCPPNPEVAPRCPECRLGLGVHDTRDPLCEAGA